MALGSGQEQKAKFILEVGKLARKTGSANITIIAISATTKETGKRI